MRLPRLQPVLTTLVILLLGVNLWFLVQLRNHDREHHHHGDDNRGSSGSTVDTDIRQATASAARHEARAPQLARLEVVSSRQIVSVSLDGVQIYEVDSLDEADRGMHMLVLDQGSGRLVFSQSFDTYGEGADAELLAQLKNTHSGRIIVLAVKDEASFSLKEKAKLTLMAMGSQHIGKLGWRDMWALVLVKEGKTVTRTLAEKHSPSPSLDNWGSAVHLSVEVELRETELCPGWPRSRETERRRSFCRQFEGYGNLCDCDDPDPLHRRSFPEPRLKGIPLAVVAGNRPKYLYRALQSLLSAQGADPAGIVVFIDGFFEEPLRVCELLGIRGVQQEPHGIKNARISQHYKASFRALFDLFPDAEYAIINEEDLDVSPDYFTYFAQTLPLLKRDATLLCVSAWNDLGYKHTSEDASLLYRVETMPGLGWMMRRSLFKDELEAKWPSEDKLWDWDMWLRQPDQLKGRECIIPDVSRTFHFGASGVNMNPYFQSLYFGKHKLNTIPSVILRGLEHMEAAAYDRHLEALVAGGRPVPNSVDPCSTASAFPEGKVDVVGGDLVHHILYIELGDGYATWLELAKCWKVWDLDIRGFHKSMWRLWINKTPVIVVGDSSPFAHYRPV